jgi:hypothetical protein
MFEGVTIGQSEQNFKIQSLAYLNRKSNFPAIFALLLSDSK